MRVFYKFAYDWNYSTSSASTGFSYYANRDYSPSHAIGIDINQGNWSHSIRMGYMKFHNQIIGDTNSQPADINPFPFAELVLMTRPSIPGRTIWRRSRPSKAISN